MLFGGEEGWMDAQHKSSLLDHDWIYSGTKKTPK